MSAVPVCSSVKLTHAPVCYAGEDLEITCSDRAFSEWTDEDLEQTFDLLLQVSNHFEHFVVVGSHGDRGFRWHIMPVNGYLNQINVVRRMILGGFENPNHGEPELTKNTFTPTPSPSYNPFTDQQVIDRQHLAEGSVSRVLYNYAPLIEPHLLFIPKQWRGDFRALDKSEFLEMCQMASIAMSRMSGTSYLFFKNGKPAGQSVPHFHFHLVSAPDERTALFAKCKIIKNILIGPSAMSAEALEVKRATYAQLLESTQKSDPQS
ncbi:MAG: HIT domain-containing protein [Chlamydiia bacterium]|nr:HIT domain-containing protein [Chlamydiia bacterium]